MDPVVLDLPTTAWEHPPGEDPRGGQNGWKQECFGRGWSLGSMSEWPTVLKGGLKIFFPFAPQPQSSNDSIDLQVLRNMSWICQPVYDTTEEDRWWILALKWAPIDWSTLRIKADVNIFICLTRTIQHFAVPLSWCRVIPHKLCWYAMQMLCFCPSVYRKIKWFQRLWLYFLSFYNLYEMYFWNVFSIADPL